jgi:hypothetical protein
VSRPVCVALGRVTLDGIGVVAVGGRVAPGGSGVTLVDEDAVLDGGGAVLDVGGIAPDGDGGSGVDEVAPGKALPGGVLRGGGNGLVDVFGPRATVVFCAGRVSQSEYHCQPNHPAAARITTATMRPTARRPPPPRSGA